MPHILWKMRGIEIKGSTAKGDFKLYLLPVFFGKCASNLLMAMKCNF